MRENDKLVVEVDGEAKFDRSATGMQECARRYRFEEIFTDFDPDELSHDYTPPPELLSAMRDVFGEWFRQGRIKVAFHPWFRRLALFERTFDPQGRENGWHCVSMFHTGGTPGKLPLDLQVEDDRFDNMTGHIGDFRLPTKRDFELITKFDTWRNTNEEIIATMREEKERERKDAELKHDAFLHDFHDYNFLKFMALANQEAGCGSKMYSTNDVTPDVDLRLTSPRYEVATEVADPNLGPNGRYIILRKKDNERREAEREAQLEKKAKSFAEMTVEELEQYQREHQAEIDAAAERERLFRAARQVGRQTGKTL
jgi:hypothetical protein